MKADAMFNIKSRWDKPGHNLKSRRTICPRRVYICVAHRRELGQNITQRAPTSCVVFYSQQCTAPAPRGLSYNNNVSESHVDRETLSVCLPNLHTHTSPNPNKHMAEHPQARVHLPPTRSWPRLRCVHLPQLPA